MVPESYRHSGQAPLGGLMLAMIATIFGSLVLGVAYSFAVCWIPIVQLSAFATLALGGGIGAIAGICARGGKIRNGAVIPFFSVIGASLALWISWVFDAKARFGMSEAPLLLDPRILLAYMTDFYEQGFWSMGQNGKPVSGIPLLIVWAIEAGALLALSFIAARIIIGSLPFCEACDQWTRKSEAFCQFLVPSEDTMIVPQIQSGDLSSLTQLQRCDGTRDGSLKLDVFRCSGCEDSSYVTINSVRVTVNKKNEAQTKLQPIVTLGKLTPEEMQHLQAIRDGLQHNAAEESSDDSVDDV